MKAILLRALALFALCSAISAASYYIFDALAVLRNTPELRRAWVLILPVHASWIAYLVFNLTPLLYHATRTAALRPFQGNHYQYLGWRIELLEDEFHYRWIATERVRTIVGQLASDHALGQIFRTGHQMEGKKGYLRDDALVAHLANATTPQAIKFKNWAERNIAFPARKVRERLGIKESDPCSDPDDLE
ncbi:MAG: hypothetical protein K9K38_08550 [Rhodoferax sp.]|nr:hypothetical protein [Rhodoferax sp.]MCF8209436.1 hypothetical protein [Rhodoferax sp.]